MRPCAEYTSANAQSRCCSLVLQCTLPSETRVTTWRCVAVDMSGTCAHMHSPSLVRSVSADAMASCSSSWRDRHGEAVPLWTFTLPQTGAFAGSCRVNRHPYYSKKKNLCPGLSATCRSGTLVLARGNYVFDELVCRDCASPLQCHGLALLRQRFPRSQYLMQQNIGEMTLFCTTSHKLYARSGFAYRDYAFCTRYLTLESQVAVEIGSTERPNSQYAHADKVHTNCLDLTVMSSHAG